MKLKSLIYLYIYLFSGKCISHQNPTVTVGTCSFSTVKLQPQSLWPSSQAFQTAQVFSHCIVIYNCRHRTLAAFYTKCREIFCVCGLIFPNTDINTSHEEQITFHLYKGNTKRKGSSL